MAKSNSPEPVEIIVHVALSKFDSSLKKANLIIKRGEDIRDRNEACYRLTQQASRKSSIKR